MVEAHSQDRFYGMVNYDSEIIRPIENVEEISQMADETRKILEIAWSKNTIHPDFRDLKGAGRFNPLGQCAVSARLLEDILNNQLPELTVSNVVGSVIDGQGKILTNNHVWLETPVGDDALIIDITPDQAEGLGENAPKVVIGLRSELRTIGYQYHSEHEDTDYHMRESSSASYDRYLLLKRRYERVKRDQAYYQVLLEGNVYIIGPVVSGKSELTRNLETILPINAIDVGKLFRAATFILIYDPEEGVRADVEKVKQGDENEIDRIIGSTLKLSKLLQRELVEKVDIQRNQINGSTLIYNGIDFEKELKDPNVDTLVPVVAKSPTVRKMVWRWINQYTQHHGGVLLTGHSIKDIDTTKYSIIHLTVDEDTAAQRLFNRSPGMYKNVADATDALKKRNALDRYGVAAHQLKDLHNITTIDTTTLSTSEVEYKALRALVKNAKRQSEITAKLKSLEIQKSDFNWEINPLLANIRILGNEIFTTLASQHQSAGITEFDIAIQTMMHLAGYHASDIYQGVDTVIGDIESLIKVGEIKAASQKFSQAVEEGTIRLNLEVVENEAKRQVQRLHTIYRETTAYYHDQLLQLPSVYMGNPESSPFREVVNPTISLKNKKYETEPETRERTLVVCESQMNQKIIFKRVAPEISDMYGKGFHYLHVGRADEFAAFGAFIEGHLLPFAWVSYSKVDRDYKKELITQQGIEAHRVLEMTRAWNASWSPKNTMSVLFAHAHEELQREYLKQVEIGTIDKPLAGVITAINGNLGFKANAFNGVGFETIGLKPAKFTYYRERPGNPLEYMSRRAIVKKLGLQSTKELINHPNYAENTMPLLPTNEMMVLFDKKEQAILAQQPIRRITSDAYA